MTAATLPRNRQGDALVRDRSAAVILTDTGYGTYELVRVGLNPLRVLVREREIPHDLRDEALRLARDWLRDPACILGDRKVIADPTEGAYWRSLARPARKGER